MEQAELQKLISKENHSQQEALHIGESYLHGEVLKDLVAAEAWLLRVLDMGETEATVRAMELLQQEVWKEKSTLEKQDIQTIQQELTSAEGERKRYLEALLKMISQK
jgi:hypothetical protein